MSRCWHRFMSPYGVIRECTPRIWMGLWLISASQWRFWAEIFHTMHFTWFLPSYSNTSLTIILTKSFIGPMSWTYYQIRKIAGCACARNAGNVFPRRQFQSKPLVSDPGMHHGTCVTHVPWCMSGSLTCGDGENVPGIPGACAPAILRIWQEAHC